MTLVYDVDGIKLYHGDCLDVMPQLEAQSIHAVICDPPYGTTACSWDSVIPFDAMWSNIKRLTQPRSAVVLFGSEPFSSLLRCSNLPWYKYDWKWKKSRMLGFTNAKNKPLNGHEDMMVFSDGTTANCSDNRMNYNPQDLIKHDKIARGNKRGVKDTKGHNYARPSHKKEYIQEYTNYPSTVLEFNSEHNADVHPTQKPLDLLRYLIRTYTNPGDTVLDFTSGSGTTLLAALVEGRRCIGIERDTDADGNSLGYIDYTIQRLRGDKVKTITENGTALQVVQPNMFATI